MGGCHTWSGKIHLAAPLFFTCRSPGGCEASKVSPPRFLQPFDLYTDYETTFTHKHLKHSLDTVNFSHTHTHTDAQPALPEAGKLQCFCYSWTRTEQQTLTKAELFGQMCFSPSSRHTHTNPGLPADPHNLDLWPSETVWLYFQTNIWAVWHIEVTWACFPAQGRWTLSSRFSWCRFVHESPISSHQPLGE